MQKTLKVGSRITLQDQSLWLIRNTSPVATSPSKPEAKRCSSCLIFHNRLLLSGITHIALRRIGCVGISNVGELKSRFGMFIFAESFNR